MREPNLVILAGGISSRMKKTAESLHRGDPRLLRDAREKSKAMIGVGAGSRPFLDYLLRNVEDAGYRDVVIVTGEGDSSIRGYYRERGAAAGYPGLAISYSVQTVPAGRTKPLGTADALLTALRSKPGWSGGKFTVCNSDNIYSKRALELLLADDHQNALIDYRRDVLRFPPERTGQFAVIRKDADGYLMDLKEKPSPEDIAGAADGDGRVGVSMNIFRLSYDMVLPFLESVPLHPDRDEKELPVAVHLMAAVHPRAVYTIPLSEHVPDLTQLSDVADVRSFLEDQ